MFAGILIRGVAVVAVVLACAIGLGAAFGLLAAADYFAFAIILPPVLAALAAAGAALLFCLAAVVVGKLVLSALKRRTRRVLQPRLAAFVGEVFGKELADVAERHPGRSIGLALAAGFALGFSPGLRRALFALLRR
ncbi:MAG: hypothetical protein ACREHF_12725 [Rhizomicrobium sp.]